MKYLGCTKTEFKEAFSVLATLDKRVLEYLIAVCEGCEDSWESWNEKKKAS